MQAPEAGHENGTDEKVSRRHELGQVGFIGIERLDIGHGQIEEAHPLAVHFDSEDPRSAVQALCAAYAVKDAAAYGARLSEDFRFVFAEPELNAKYAATGFGRVDEIASAHHLFEGFTNEFGRKLPAARKIAIDTGDLELHGDPEPADFDERAIVVADRLTLAIEFVDGTAHVSRTTNLYWISRPCLVNGGGTAASREWTIRRWQEEPPRSLVEQVRATPFARCNPMIASAD